MCNILQPGDLVLLKDSNCERLEKIIAACTPGGARPPSAAAGSTIPAAGAERPILAVAGLGNPDEQSQGTPHNVGQRVPDRLAQAVRREWVQEEQALVACVERWGTDVYLIKPLSYVNVTGPVLVPSRSSWESDRLLACWSTTAPTCRSAPCARA